jgi:hypothetical protein
MYHRKLRDRTDLCQHSSGSIGSPMHKSPTLLAGENCMHSVLSAVSGEALLLHTKDLGHRKTDGSSRWQCRAPTALLTMALATDLLTAAIVPVATPAPV